MDDNKSMLYVVAIVAVIAVVALVVMVTGNRAYGVVAPESSVDVAGQALASYSLKETYTDVYFEEDIPQTIYGKTVLLRGVAINQDVVLSVDGVTDIARIRPRTINGLKLSVLDTFGGNSICNNYGYYITLKVSLHSTPNDYRTIQFFKDSQGVYDTMEVFGKSVHILGVGTNDTVIISVDSVSDTVGIGRTKIINGLSVKNEDTSYLCIDASTDQSSANLRFYRTVAVETPKPPKTN